MNELKSVIYETTLECNLNCKHCGSNSKLKRENELTTKEAKDLMNQLKELGLEYFYFSGGEPFLRKDLKELIKHSQDLDFKTGIVTNATLITKKDLNFLQKQKDLVIGVSLDGNKKIHNKIRGNTYDTIYNNLKELKKHNIETSIITTVNKYNFNYLEDILLTNIFLKIDSWQIQITNPMGRMKQEEILNNQEYKKLSYIINDFRKNYSKLINIQGADCTGLGDKNLVTDYKWKGCQAGKTSIGILSNGDITGCLSIQEPKYIEDNIRNKPLKKIWENPNNFKYNRQERIYQGKCKTCKELKECKAGCTSTNISFKNINKSPYCMKLK